MMNRRGTEGQSGELAGGWVERMQGLGWPGLGTGRTFWSLLRLERVEDELGSLVDLLEILHIILLRSFLMAGNGTKVAHLRHVLEVDTIPNEEPAGNSLSRR